MLMLLLLSCSASFAQDPISIERVERDGQVLYLFDSNSIRKMLQIIAEQRAAAAREAEKDRILELQAQSLKDKDEIISLKDASLANKDEIIRLERELHANEQKKAALAEKRVADLEEAVKLANRVINRNWLRRTASAVPSIIIGAAIGIIIRR